MGVAAVIGAVGAAGVYVASKSANEQKRAQDRALQEQRAANEQAREQAQAEAERADIEYNRAVQKQPEVEAIVSRSEQAAKAGPAATVLTNNRRADAGTRGQQTKGMGGGSLLTGGYGVDPSVLNLGGNTLLGS